MFSYNLAENSIGFSYWLEENTHFTTDLAENRVLFTSATSFTLKKRAHLPSSEPSETPCESWSHLFVNVHTDGFIFSRAVKPQLAGLAGRWPLTWTLPAWHAGFDRTRYHVSCVEKW
jgi:hypothetical protein